MGGVTIGGSDGFDVVAPAAYVEIDGFVFTHASGKTQVRSGASHVRFTHNVFECAGGGAYLTLGPVDPDCAAKVDTPEEQAKIYTRPWR